MFSRHQLLQRGVSADAIDRRVGNGSWIRFTAGVYGYPSHAGTWRRQLWIALLAHPGSAAGLATAAAIHGFEGFGDGPIELVLPPGSNARSSVAKIHRFEGARTTLVRGIPVTTKAQTFVDLSGSRHARRVEPAMDRCILGRGVTVPELDERATFYEDTRRKGHPFFVALVDERKEDAWRPSESVLEDPLRRLGRRLVNVEVEWQPDIPWRAPGDGRLDAFVRSAGVILEADGRTWHARVKDFDADRWRDNQAVAHGLVVLRFTFVHLVHRFDDCLDLTLETIQQRRRRPA